jgi:hypothetical protein
MADSTLVALGDSHLEALQFAADLGLISARDVKLCIVPGATAVGLRNPNSATNALGTFRQFVTGLPRSVHVLLHLGEVDCGFVIWWMEQVKGESIERQFEDSLKAYRDFVVELQKSGFEKICVTGASLPTIRDGVEFGEVANLRREVRVSLLKRTELTLRYNASLRQMACDLGCHYFELTSGVLDQFTGTVSENFLNPDPRDHHLDPRRVAGLWARCCNEFLERFAA